MIDFNNRRIVPAKYKRHRMIVCNRHAVFLDDNMYTWPGCVGCVSIKADHSEKLREKY